MNKRYAKGRRFEYRVKQKFEREGYVVFRLAGSRPVDLVAFRPGEKPIFVECKAKASFAMKQVEELKLLAARCDATLVLALNKRRRIVLKEINLSGEARLKLENTPTQRSTVSGEGGPATPVKPDSRLGR